MIVREVSTIDDFYNLKNIWDKLLLNSSDNNIFLTWEWQYTWYKHFGGNRKLCILVVEDGPEIIGIMPYIHSSPDKYLLRYTMVESIGGEVSDYKGIIIDIRDKSKADNAIELLGKYMIDHRIIMVSDQVSVTSGLHSLAQNRVFIENISVVEKRSSIISYIVLPPKLEEYLDSLNRHNLRELQRKKRNLERLGKLQTRRTVKDTMKMDLDIYWYFHNIKLAKKNLPPIDDTSKEFYKDVFSLFLENDWLHFSFMELDGAPISIQVGFQYYGKYYGYLMVYEDKYGKYSPGSIHILDLLTYLYDNNFNELDFLRGSEAYKTNRWKTSTRYNSKLIILKKQPLNDQLIKYIDLRWRYNNFMKHSLYENYMLYLDRMDHAQVA